MKPLPEDTVVIHGVAIRHGTRDPRQRKYFTQEREMGIVQTYLPHFNRGFIVADRDHQKLEVRREDLGGLASLRKNDRVSFLRQPNSGKARQVRLMPLQFESADA